MRIATYNINGINGRLETLLAWLYDTRPDLACLQEFKAPQAKFPEKQLAEAGYEAIWHGKAAGTAWRSRSSCPPVRAGLACQYKPWSRSMNPSSAFTSSSA